MSKIELVLAVIIGLILVVVWGVLVLAVTIGLTLVIVWGVLFMGFITWILKKVDFK